ncbi:MAG: class F sortase [Sphaerobacteraceae bacterium]|nr:MAG: class F sortase [Sphaerobacteraceae bacterium]
MASAVRNRTQSRSLARRWIAGLLLIIGLGASALILSAVMSESSPQTESSQVQVPASITPTPEPTGQAVVAEEVQPSETSALETPEPTPASTPTTPAPTSEPTAEDDTATFAEAPSATATQQATSVPESGSFSNPDGSSPGSTDDNSSSSSSQGSNEPAPTVPSAPTTGSGSSRSSTMKIEIPAIGVNAPVEVKSIDANGVMENPSSFDAVAWYDFTSRPEDRGNAVFAGHLDYAGVGPAVFWKLGSLSSGDEVRVTLGDGSIVKYRVTGVRSVPADADASDIVASGDVPKITIITCEGSFDPSSQNYNKRTIVTGERVG